MTTRGLFYIPASTSAQEHLKRVAKQADEERKKKAEGPFQATIPAPTPGAPVNRALFQAGFPLGVAQRVEEPATLFGRAGLAEAAEQQGIAALFGRPGAEERGKELAQGLRESFQPTLGRLGPTGRAAPVRPVGEIVQEAEAQPGIAQGRLPVGTGFADVRLGTLLGALQTLQERYVEPSAGVVLTTLSRLAPGERGKAETRYRELRDQGVGWIEAARQAVQEVPLPPGARGLAETVTPDILLPGIGFGGPLARGATTLARRGVPLTRDVFLAPAKGLLTGAVGEGAGKAISKAPWQMTRADYIRLRAKPKPSQIGESFYSGDVNRLNKSHKASVAQALAKSKPVPPEVLADYPDLVAQQARAAEVARGQAEFAVPAAPIAKPPRAEGQTQLSEAARAESERLRFEIGRASQAAEIGPTSQRTANLQRVRQLRAERRRVEAQVEKASEVAAPAAPKPPRVRRAAQKPETALLVEEADEQTVRGFLQAAVGLGKDSTEIMRGASALARLDGKPKILLHHVVESAQYANADTRQAFLQKALTTPEDVNSRARARRALAWEGANPSALRRAAPKPAAAPTMEFTPASAIAPEVGKQTIDPALLRRLQETLQPPPQTEADVSAFIARRRARLARLAAIQPAPGAAPSPAPPAAGQALPPAPAAPVAAAGAPPPVKPPVAEAAPITTQPERGFITHTAESPMGSPILRELYDEEPIVYSPITDRETLQKASEAVNADPIGARARLMADAPINPKTMVADLAQGFVLMRKAANEGNVTELRDLSKRIAERYTPVAQALQVASTIDKLSPEGLFVYTQRLIEQAVAKGKGPAVATRLRIAARRAEVKEATANAAADVASAEGKVVQARQNVSATTETATRTGTLKGSQRAKDFQYLIDDTVREVRAKLTPAERQAIIKAKAILKQSVAEMDEATANSFLDRAAGLKTLDGEARVQALMDLVDEVRQLPQVQAGIVAGKPLKPSAKLLKQQAADLAQLVDRTARNVFQQLNSVDRLAVARVKAILRRTDVELPQGMAEELLQEAHSLRGLPLAERASALNRLTTKIKEFDPVAKELARKRIVADAEARVRQAARQAANDLATLIDASSRKVVKHVTAADRMAISQAKTVLRRFGAELPTEMAEDFLTRARALNNLPDAEQAAGVKALVNEIKDFSPVKQAREELALARSRAAAAKQSAKDLQYLANEEARVSKARLRNVERETIRSAKARLKDAGVEMPEELAQSFLDRAKALRGITDEYDQMRAAQSLLADVHNLVPGSKINAFFDIIGLPRIFQAAYDLSFSLRQGIVHAWAHPRQWAEMFKTGLKSFASEDAALAADRQFFKRPLHKPGQEAGLEYIDRWGSIGQQEETFINSWTERVPGIRQSNRAYIAQGNKLRADAFDAKVIDWLPPDVREEVYWGRKSFETLDELVAATGKSRKDFERLAQWQNVLTGRGDLGNFLRSNNQWLSALFYAPRFAVSRFEVPIFAMRNLVANPALRKMVAKDLAASIVGSTATLYLLSKLPGVEVEWDPRSSDWRKVKIGPLRISLDGGFDTLIRQVVQISLSQRKSITTGKVKDVVPTDLIWDFIQSKFAPAGSFAADALDRKDFLGNPLDTPEAWAKRVAEAWAPFITQDVYEATQEFGAPGIGVAPLSAFGAGVNVYEPRVTPRRRLSPLRSRRSRLTIRPTPTQGAPSRLRSPVEAGR